MNEIETLKKLGFTEYETKIYIKLLELGPSKATEITKISGVPKNKVYELLDKLSREGIVELVPTIPKKYFIRNTDYLKTLIDQKENEFKELRVDISKIDSKRKKPFSINMKEVVWIANGHEAFVEKIKEAMPLVKKENFIVARKIRTDPVLIRLTKEAITRGAKVKMLIPQDLERSLLGEWEKIGVKIRYMTFLPEITFSIFDDKLCRINLSINDVINDPTLWIENKSFIQILREKFILLWKQAKP